MLYACCVLEDGWFLAGPSCSLKVNWKKKRETDREGIDGTEFTGKEHNHQRIHNRGYGLRQRK